MSLLINLSYLTILTFLSFESYFYQGFTQKHFFLNPYLLLLLYIIVFLISSFFTKIKLKPFISKSNNLLLPISTIIYFVSFYLEKYTYKNFIYTYSHINFETLIYLIIFSLSTLYLSKTPKIKSKKTFYLLPFLILIFLFAFEKYNPKLFIIFLQEDGIAEYIQFIFYSLASIFFFKSIKKSKNIYKIIFITLFIISLFVAGEEISWGQRIFGIETPEGYKQINQQNEITIHNINYIQHNLLHKAYILVGLGGTFSPDFRISVS